MSFSLIPSWISTLPSLSTLYEYISLFSFNIYMYVYILVCMLIKKKNGLLLGRRMEGIQLQGPIPILLFAPTLLQTVWVKLNMKLSFGQSNHTCINWVVFFKKNWLCSVLKRNQLDGTLDFGTTTYSKQLELVDLQNNEITKYYKPAANKGLQVVYVSVHKYSCFFQVNYLWCVSIFSQIGR